MSSFTEGRLEYKQVGVSKRTKRTIFEITKPFTYVVGPYENPYFTVEIKKGFRTDFASIPWPLHYIIKQDGPYAKAACVHDYLLQKIEKYKGDPNYPYLTRLVADSIFYEAMLVSGVPKYVAWPFYTSVRIMSIVGYGFGLMNFFWRNR